MLKSGEKVEESEEAVLTHNITDRRTDRLKDRQTEGEIDRQGQHEQIWSSLN